MKTASICLGSTVCSPVSTSVHSPLLRWKARSSRTTIITPRPALSQHRPPLILALICVAMAPRLSRKVARDRSVPTRHGLHQRTHVLESHQLQDPSSLVAKAHSPQLARQSLCSNLSTKRRSLPPLLRLLPFHMHRTTRRALAPVLSLPNHCPTP